MSHPRRCVLLTLFCAAALALLAPPIAGALTIKDVDTKVERGAARGGKGGIATLTIIARTRGADRLISYSWVGKRVYWQQRRGKFVSSARVAIPAGNHRKVCYAEQFILRGARDSRVVMKRVCFRMKF